jgi:hypothetical protein
VCKPWTTAAQHVLYLSIHLDSPRKAFLFLEGQLNSASAIAAKFVQTLNIRQKNKDEFIAPELFELLARYCSNVEYLLADADSPLFWICMVSLVGSHYWKNIKSIPYHHRYSGSYALCANHFRHSLTELTMNDNGNLDSAILKQIAVDFPNLRALEIFNNQQVIKEIHQLNLVSHHLPNLHHLCLDRGHHVRSIQAELFQRKVIPNNNIQSIAIRIKALDDIVITYLSAKFPCLERLKIVIHDPLLPNEKRCPIKHLFHLCMSASSNYQLKFSVKDPRLALDTYFRLLPEKELKHLTVAYTADRLNPTKKITKEYEGAVVEVGKNDDCQDKRISVYYSFYDDDEKYVVLPGKLLQGIGKYLSTLTMQLDDGNLHYLPPNKDINGHFLDNHVFRYCHQLTRLVLVCYSLFSCKNGKRSSETIQELILERCRVGPILDDISSRLPNLKRIALIDCSLGHLHRNGACSFDLPYTAIENLSILGNDPLLPLVQIYFDLTLPSGRHIFMQNDPNSTHLHRLSPQEYFATYHPKFVVFRLNCRSIKYLRICFGSTNVEMEFDAF